MGLEQMMDLWFAATSDALTRMRMISTGAFVKIRSGQYKADDWASDVVGIANAGMDAWAKLYPYGSTQPIAVISTTTAYLAGADPSESVHLCDPLHKDAAGNWPPLTLGDLQCVTDPKIPALKAKVSVSSQVGETILVAVSQFAGSKPGIYQGVVQKDDKVIALVIVFVS
jgi:hypothetical protein